MGVEELWMALTRAYEEHEVTPDLRRLYGNIRTCFDLPFVPSIFKLAAAVPEYLRKTWDDLSHVACSREFQSAATAFQEVAHSAAVSGGWTFSDQPKMLAAEKFSNTDIRVIGGIVSLFARVWPQMALFMRLMQRGYSGGQRGRVSSARQVSALSQLVRINIPNERDDQINGSFGFKFVTGSGIILVGNTVWPLNRGGLRPNVLWTFGLEYSF